jgi:two-component system chemotaxis response regulator CheB
MMPPHLVVVGASLGALDALRALLPALPLDFPAALIIVLHRDKEESRDLIPLLKEDCVLPVVFPLDKELILAGHVYMAPSNYHLLVEGDHFAYSVDEPEDYARPSINILFESAAEAYGTHVTGIVLTGMRRDGARGLLAIERHHGTTLVQEPAEAIAPEMPRAALAAVPGAKKMSLVEIGQWLSTLRH